MALRQILNAEALCVLCDRPLSWRVLWRDDETGFEEWGEWEPLAHNDRACYRRTNGVGKTVLREAKR